MATPHYLLKKFPALKHLIAKERMSMWCYCMLHFIYYRPKSYLFIHLVNNLYCPLLWKKIRVSL